MVLPIMVALKMEAYGGREELLKLSVCVVFVVAGCCSSSSELEVTAGLAVGAADVVFTRNWLEEEKEEMLHVHFLEREEVVDAATCLRERTTSGRERVVGACCCCR